MQFLEVVFMVQVGVLRSQVLRIGEASFGGHLVVSEESKNGATAI